MVVAPNKSSVYPEKLPSSIVYKKGETLTDAIVESARNKNITLLDLREILQEHKKDNTLLYYKTDTHWNNKGAAIGYEETIHFLNTAYEKNYKLPEYTLRETREGGGDLAGFLKIKEALSPTYEINFAFQFTAVMKVCHGYIDPKDHKLQACRMENNPIVNIFAQDQYVINKEAMNSEKLLLVADSFSTANSKPYNATFATLWKLHQNRLHGKKLTEFVEKNRPDIVIYQIVERDLYTQTLVEPLE